LHSIDRFETVWFNYIIAFRRNPDDDD